MDQQADRVVGGKCQGLTHHSQQVSIGWKS